MLALIDECAFLTQPLRKRTWGQRGVRPVVRVPGSRRKVSVIAGILRSLKGVLHERFAMTRQNYTAERCFWFVIDMWRRSGRRLVVIWDNLQAHRKAAAACRDLRIPGLWFEWLPKYAPDLNPVEALWSSTKWGSLGNYVPGSLEELEARVTTELRSRTRRQRFLRSLFRQAGLTP